MSKITPIIKLLIMAILVAALFYVAAIATSEMLMDIIEVVK